MDLLLWCENKNKNKLDELLKRDDTVSRGSIVLKDAKLFGKEGYYFYIKGDERIVERAKEISKEIAKEIVGEEKENFLKVISEEENKALEGFGAILG